MKASMGTGRQRGNSHNELYWKRLKKQFSAGAYDHTGAYSELRQLQMSQEMAKLKRHFELAEQIMLTEQYRNLRERMAFGKNTKRLSAVLDLKVSA